MLETALPLGYTTHEINPCTISEFDSRYPFPSLGRQRASPGACKMDPVSLIEGALVAGATASAKDVASQAVKDAYTGLKTVLSRLFVDQPTAQVILAEHEADPQTYEKPLKKLLIEAHADQETELLDAAERVMTLVQPQQIGMSKFTIQNTGTVQGQNIGDHNTITQTFGNLPKA